MAIDLEQFLPEGKSNGMLNKIMHYDGFDIASNGHYIIFQSNEDSTAIEPSEILKASFAGYIKLFNSSYIVRSIKSLEITKSVICDYCNGTGKTFDSHYTGCVRCANAGFRSYPAKVPYIKAYAGYGYLKKIMSQLPEVKIAIYNRPIEPETPLIFTFDGGFAALAQIKIRDDT